MNLVNLTILKRENAIILSNIIEIEMKMRLYINENINENEMVL